MANHPAKKHLFMKQNILITNDDGVASKGLRALIEEASRFGRVTVVAPEQGMSGMSHAITMSNPLYLRKIRQRDEIGRASCRERVLLIV